jgi:glucan phosphoethanolaminetransferase (alkaline phosphatase superfamily)
MLPNVFKKTNTTKKGKKETHLRWWVTFLISLGLALGTWNPSGYHFIHYISQQNIFSGFTPFAIILMFGIWMLALKSIFQSLKMTGALFVIIVIMAFLWGLKQYGLIDFTNLTQMGWVGTISVAFIIWVGLNASIIWKTLTGVYATDSVEED